MQADDGVRLPPFRKLTLTNGLTLVLLERHQVPLVSFRVLIRAGGVDDPAGREGLALLTTELLQHGTQHRTATQIAAELDFIGASLEAGGENWTPNFLAEFQTRRGYDLKPLLPAVFGDFGDRNLGCGK